MKAPGSKRIISLLLIILILIGLMPVQAFAAETSGSTQELPEPIHISWVNPYYDIQIDPPELPAIRPYAVPRDLTYHSTTASAAKVVRTGLKNRAEAIEFGYLIPVEDFTEEGLGELISTIQLKACGHTGVSTEGDYLRWNCVNWSVDAYTTGSSSDGSCYKTVLILMPTYLSTASQEQTVTDKVSALLTELSPSGSDYNKLKTVYDWMCANIRYDYDNLNDKSYLLKHSAYAAIVQKKAVCQGYALLLYRLALEMDIDCRIIVGLGNGGGHAWNIVELNGLYYNLDSTWDAGCLNYNYFLRCDKNFEDHVRDADYTTNSFYADYPMGTADYSPTSAKAPAAPTVKASCIASSGKPKLTWDAVSGAAKYEVYRATSKSGTYSLLKTLTGTSLTNTSTETGKTYYYKVRSVGADGSKSDFSSVVSRACDLPRPEVSVSNVASTGKPKLTWNKVEGAAKYEVYRSTSKSGTYNLLKTLTGTSLTNTSAAADTTYYYKVKAIHSNSAANSAYSSVVSCTCGLPKPEVTVTNVASTGKIKLTWNKIEGASQYEVYRSTSKNGTYSLLKTLTGTSLTNTSTEVGKTYYYKVRAVTAGGTKSAFSSIVSRTCDLPRPALTVTLNSKGNPKLSWTKVDGTLEYEVYRSTNASSWSLLKTTSGTGLTNTSVTAGTKYYYRVRAIHDNSSANSAYSSYKSITAE